MENEEYAMNPQPVRPIPPPISPTGGPSLEYARPMPVELDRSNSPAHQCAKAAWVAPLIAVLLSCLAGTTLKDQSSSDRRIISLILAGVFLVLVVAGLTCGIVALCNVKGRRGIISPSVVGIILSAGLLGLLGTGFISGWSRTVARRALPPPAPISSPQSALRQTGWLGTTMQPGYSMGLVEMAGANADTVNFKSEFTQDFSMMAFWAKNDAGGSPIVLSIDNASLEFADGTVVTSLKTRDVLNSARSDRAALVAKFGGPFTCAPGETRENMFLFFPPGQDLANLKSVTVKVNGAGRTIPGRIFTADEKTVLMNPSGKRSETPAR